MCGMAWRVSIQGKDFMPGAKGIFSRARLLWQQQDVESCALLLQPTASASDMGEEGPAAKALKSLQKQVIISYWPVSPRIFLSSSHFRLCLIQQDFTHQQRTGS